MSRIMLLVVAVVYCLSGLVSPAPADLFYMNDGSKRNDLWAASFAGGSGVHSPVMVYSIVNGQLKGRFEPLAIAELKGIDFEEGDGKPGRVAHVISSDGKSLFNCTVEAVRRSGERVVFRLRKAGVPPGGETVDVDASRVSYVNFAPAPYAMHDGVAPGSGTSGSGGPPPISVDEDEEEEDYIGNQGGSRLPRPGSGSAPMPVAAPGEAMPGSDEWVNEITGIGTVYGTNPDGSQKQPSPFLIQPAVPQENPTLGFGGMEIKLIAGFMAVIMVINFFTGTFVLMFSAKNEGVSDLTVPRAIICSAMLSFIPSTLFILCLWIIPVFNAIKLFAGVLCFWYSARMIVMSFLEVLESKATDVMISYYAITILLIMIFWIYMTWK